MQDVLETQEEKELEPKPQGEQEEPQGTDWKAEARKWEDRAKENLKKAKAYDEALKERQKQEPTLQALQNEVETLKAANEAAKAEAERLAMLNVVSSATGVPVNLIHGKTEEEMTTSANSVLEFAKTNAPKMPEDKGGGASSKALSAEDINKIKDPVARVRARAEFYKQQKE